MIPETDQVERYRCEAFEIGQTVHFVFQPLTEADVLRIFSRRPSAPKLRMTNQSFSAGTAARGARPNRGNC